jgi:hypothetical protein
VTFKQKRVARFFSERKTALSFVDAAMFLLAAVLLQLTLSQPINYFIDAVNGNDVQGCGLGLAAACKSLGFCVQANPPTTNNPITYNLATGFYKDALNTNLSWTAGTVNPPITFAGTPGLTAEVDFGGLAVVWSFVEYPNNVTLVNLTLQSIHGAGILFTYTQGTLATSFNIINCVFQRNVYAQVAAFPYAPYGSALNIHTTLATTNIYNTQFIDHQGDTHADSYGPIVVTAGTVLLSQVLFAQNTANFGGLSAICNLPNGCNNFLITLADNTTFQNNVGANTSALFVSGFSLQMTYAWLSSNTALVDTIRIVATNASQTGSANIVSTLIVNNTARHGVFVATQGAFTSYLTTVGPDSVIQYNSNLWDGGLGVGLFCFSSQLVLNNALVSLNTNINGTTGGAVDYFGSNCQAAPPTPNTPTTQPNTPTNTAAPTSGGGPNAAAIVIPLILIAVLIGLAVVAYIKWDRIKAILGRSEYTRINENTRL